MMDDGIAIAVLENLKNNLEAIGVEVIICETDFQFCFHGLKEDDFVIVLDAAYLAAPTGTVYTCELEEVINAYEETEVQHDMNIFYLMRLYSKPLKGRFIGIEIAEVGLGCGLSEAIKIKFNAICLQVEKIIYEIVEGV